MSRLTESCRTAFVTGAGSGLGRAFCEMLLAEGVRVWGSSRDPRRLAALAAQPNFAAVTLDLADGLAAEAAYRAAARAAGGAFDLVINNAGFGVFGSFATVDWSRWEAQISAMLGTTARLAHAACREMLARNRGCLVNVSSLAVDFPLPLMSGYNVVKAGLSALSESLIFETRGTGVTIIDFRPGDYRTDFNLAMQTEASSSGAPPDQADPRAARVWRRLDQHLIGGPPPARAARDLLRALRRGRSGTVRSGSFFQARLAPALSRIAPRSWVRSATSRYFGV